jgi:hypothetical protein
MRERSTALAAGRICIMAQVEPGCGRRAIEVYVVTSFRLHGCCWADATELFGGADAATADTPTRRGRYQARLLVALCCRRRLSEGRLAVHPPLDAQFTLFCVLYASYTPYIACPMFKLELDPRLHLRREALIG